MIELSKVIPSKMSHTHGRLFEFCWTISKVFPSVIFSEPNKPTEKADLLLEDLLLEEIDQNTAQTRCLKSILSSIDNFWLTTDNYI